MVTFRRDLSIASMNALPLVQHLEPLTHQEQARFITDYNLSDIVMQRLNQNFFSGLMLKLSFSGHKKTLVDSVKSFLHGMFVKVRCCEEHRKRLSLKSTRPLTIKFHRVNIKDYNGHWNGYLWPVITIFYMLVRWKNWVQFAFKCKFQWCGLSSTIFNTTIKKLYNNENYLLLLQIWNLYFMHGFLIVVSLLAILKLRCWKLILDVQVEQ